MLEPKYTTYRAFASPYSMHLNRLSFLFFHFSHTVFSREEVVDVINDIFKEASLFTALKPGGGGKARAYLGKRKWSDLITLRVTVY